MMQCLQILMYTKEKHDYDLENALLHFMTGLLLVAIALPSSWQMPHSILSSTTLTMTKYTQQRISGEKLGGYKVTNM